MEISGKGFFHFYQQASSLIGNQTNHRTNMCLSYYSNSCNESYYECICIVINGKIRSVPLNIFSSVYTMYKQQSIQYYKHSRRGYPGCFVQQWCMQQKVHLLNVNSIGQNMGEEIYSNTLFNRL